MHARLALLACLLAALPLAGCLRTPDPTPTFAPTCPSWVEQPGSANPTNLFSPRLNNTLIRDEVGTGFLRYDGYPLDQIVLDFTGPAQQGGRHGIIVVDGILTARLTRDGQPIGAALDGQTSAQKSEWRYGPGTYANFTWLVQLASPSSPPAPGPIVVEWQLQRNLDGNPDTPSEAAIRYQAHFLHRTCNADGASTKA